MKTGNGATPNPRKIFGGPMKKDTSNIVKPKAPVRFSAKKDSFKGNK